MHCLRWDTGVMASGHAYPSPLYRRNNRLSLCVLQCVDECVDECIASKIRQYQVALYKFGEITSLHKTGTQESGKELICSRLIASQYSTYHAAVSTIGSSSRSSSNSSTKFVSRASFKKQKERGLTTATITSNKKSNTLKVRPNRLWQSQHGCHQQPFHSQRRVHQRSL